MNWLLSKSFPILQFIKRIKTTLSSDSVALFPELSYQEIANKIEEPLSNVKIKLLRAKKLLAEIIQNKR
jgi:RNA polymerase sigma-70 factor (ECF subfamily)